MYDYEKEKHKIFTERGLAEFTVVWCEIHRLLKISGAFVMPIPLRALDMHDTHEALAYIDRIVELGEIIEITPSGTPWHKRVFVSRKWNEV